MLLQQVEGYLPIIQILQISLQTRQRINITVYLESMLPLVVDGQQSYISKKMFVVGILTTMAFLTIWI